MKVWRIRGLVQGVGFRPCVWRLANELGLAGWVRNDAAGVTLALADAAAGERLLARLREALPPLARIDRIDAVAAAPVDPPLAPGFRILDSRPGPVTTAIGPDAAICPDCVLAKTRLEAASDAIELDYRDITGSTKTLKEFLALRDHDELFAPVVEAGRIGIRGIAMAHHGCTVLVIAGVLR